MGKLARDQTQRARLLGPWCHPRDGKAPPLRIGQAPLLTALGDSGALWSLGGPTGIRGLSPLSAEDVERWKDVCQQVRAALPLIPCDVAHALTRHGLAAPGGAALVVTTGQQVTALSGRSLLGAFAWSIASCVLHRPLPIDLVVTADLERGELRPVEGLEAKLGVLHRQAPFVRRVVVAADQKVPDTSLDVIRCRTLAELLEVGFPDMEATFARQLQEEKDLERAVSDLFELARGPRNALTSWEPALRAVECVPAASCSADQEARLAFARAVVHRHQGSDATITEDAVQLVLQLPEPLRTESLAHLVQHVADGGTGAELLLDDARETLEQFDGPRAFPAHLKLRGAFGRYLANAGRPADALRHQEQAADGWLRRDMHAEVSHPLCEWFRLSWVCEDRDALLRADSVYARVVDRLDPGSRPFVEAARGRAQLWLLKNASVVPALKQVALDTTAPNFVRWNAARTLLRAGCADDDVRAWVEADAGEHAANGRALIDLDRGRSDEAAQRVADGLGQLTRLLREACEGDWPAYLQRHAPY